MYASSKRFGKSKRMRRLLLGGAVLIVLAAGAVWISGLGQARGMEAVELLALLDQSEMYTATGVAEGGFPVFPVTIAGETRLVVNVDAPSKVVWTVTVPPGASVRALYAMRPECWEADGGGAQFRIGVSDGYSYREHMRQFLSPTIRAEDRRWFSVTVDLGRYEGRTIQLIFNTDVRPAVRGDAPAGESLAVWGEPTLRAWR
jgi:hypothetical protein